MATGDQNDIEARLRSHLPVGWFPVGSSPVVDAVISGIAFALSAIYTLLLVIKQQSRIALATGPWLDIAAYDYLGMRVVRGASESDTSFRTRARREIVRARATRAAIIAELTDLTVVAPLVFEPRNTSDTGGWSSGGVSYGGAGGYGSLTTPFQLYVTAYRPHVPGIPSVDGWGGSIGGYGVGQLEYVSAADEGGVSDDQIRSAVLSVLPAGTVCWLQIQNAPNGLGYQLDYTFILDRSSVS